MKKMSNESWHRVEVSTYGVLEPLVNWNLCSHLWQNSERSGTCNLSVVSG